MKSLFRRLTQWVLSKDPSYDTRFGVVVGVLLFYVGVIVLFTVDTMTTHREDYQRLTSKLKREDRVITPLRGFIYGERGEMLAASLPRYSLYFDFRDANTRYNVTVNETINGKLKKKIVTRIRLPKDTLLHYFGPNGAAAKFMEQIDPRRTAAQHGQRVIDAYNRCPKDPKARHPRFVAIRDIHYLDYKRMRDSVPFFRLGPNKSCSNFEETPHRNRPYGDRRRGSATIGGVFASDTFRIVNGQRINLRGHGRNGLEERFDSLLAGRPGRGYIQQIQGQSTMVVQQEPVDGADVYTTLDMEMQTVLDYELGKRIVELHAEGGWAAFMEAKTGKIKALSNLHRNGEQVSEDFNHFVMSRQDPGSTFKTVSYMVMLDDGKITPDDMIDTENYDRAHPKPWFYRHDGAQRYIRDDHPVGRVSADGAIEQSSNIAIAKFTVKAYEDDPQRFLNLIYKTGVFEDLHLSEEFYGALPPKKRQHKDGNWSGISLPQISYGYETEIPSMYILNFYNAIANGGRLMRPYIVDHVEKDGRILLQHEPEVINKQICTDKTLQQVRQALEHVVERGTARSEWNNSGDMTRQGAGSRKLRIAGKTGTAQRYDERTRSYNNSGHYVSFVGYFPADDPQYTGIVVMDVRGFHNAGGGYMAGPVFRNVAEQIYAQSCTRKVKEVTPDSANVAQYGMLPTVKRGSEVSTHYVLRHLDLLDASPSLKVRNVELQGVTPGVVPNVVGMGAAEALYMLESAGLRVRIAGTGAVASQSLPAGTSCQRGTTIVITLK